MPHLSKLNLRSKERSENRDQLSIWLKSITARRYDTLIIIALWGILICVNGLIRPLQPSNELHHASIAWEMFQHRHFLVPVQSGLPYAEKTPFLYWLIHIGWIAFGVSTWWIRLLPQLFILGSLLVTRALAKLLWPEHRDLALIAPLIVLGDFVWALQNYITWFDMLIIFFIISSLYCLFRAILHPNKKNWFYWGLVTGLGLLAKGPVIFIFVLPPAFLAYFWGGSRDNWKGIYRSIFFALALIILIFLCWAVPACLTGGGQYTHDLFLKQSVERMTGRHGMDRVWYFYLMGLPLLLAPWFLWFRPWKNLFSYFHQEKTQTDVFNFIFLGAAIVPSFMILSFFGSKSFSYLFPAIPLVALLIGFLLVNRKPTNHSWDNIFFALFYLLLGSLYFIVPHFISIKLKTHYFWIDELSPWWGSVLLALGVFWLWWQEKNLTRLVLAVAISSIIFCTVLQISIFRIVAQHNDWRNLSAKIAALQEENIQVAFPNNDHAPEELFEFFGRLKNPIVIPRSEAQNWIKAHPNGWLVIKDSEVSPAQYDLYPAKIFDNKAAASFVENGE